MNKFKEIFEAVGGRKALFLLLLIVAALIVIFFLDKDKFESLMQWLTALYGIFCTGNSVSKFIGIKKDEEV